MVNKICNEENCDCIIVGNGLCRKHYQRLYYKNNRQKVIDIVKKYQQNNQSKVNKYQKKYRKRKKEQCSEIVKNLLT